MINGKVVTSATPTKYVPVNSSSDSRKTKIAAAIRPGAANGNVTVSVARSAEAPMLRAASSSSPSTRANGARGDPYRDHKSMHGVHEHNPGDRAVEPDHVEQPGDVEIDSNTRECLRQQDNQQNQAVPGQRSAAERIACRNGEQQADEHGDRGDQDARAEGGKGVTRRLKDLAPVPEAIGHWQFVREIPLD